MPDASPTPNPLPNELAHLPFAYLTTTGRRTGTPHRIEIWFALDQDQVFLISGGRDRADWVRNIQANPAITIELGTESFDGTAEIIAPDSPEDHLARQLLVEKYRQGNDLEEWGRTSLPVRITLAHTAT
jgi:deazaflavin-dependent oxidoreductase (nitroreductase family)